VDDDIIFLLIADVQRNMPVILWNGYAIFSKLTDSTRWVW